MNQEEQLREELIIETKKIFKKYPIAYSKEEQEDILESIKGFSKDRFYRYMYREIYDQLGLLDDDKNLYYGFVDLLEEKFGLDRNIVEVGGGILPRVADRIALKQKTGTINVYDPRLAYTHSDRDNLLLHRERFYEDKLPKDCDLIIGVQPYGGTHKILDAVRKNKLDFMIALGELPEQNKEYYMDDIDFDFFQSQLIANARSIVRENDLGELKVVEFEQYGSEYPVIYNKRKKM